MNTATVLHRTAMELYDLADIYKAKGETKSFDDYKNRAWLLEYEAALQVLSEPKDFTFKYLIINSAGKLGFEVGAYEAAKKILELGLTHHPNRLLKIEMEHLLHQLNEKIETKNDVETDVILGTLTSADVEQNNISIRESSSQQIRSIDVPLNMIKEVVRYYLGEFVTIQLDKDDSGVWLLKKISRAL